MVQNRVKAYLFVIIGLCIGGLAKAQTQHHPYYDVERKVHFGFAMGTNFADFKYTFSDNFYRNDSLETVNVGLIPGITLGAICNFHIRERLDFRFIPSLLLSQRNVNFLFRDEPENVKTIESVYADLPMYFKYKSTRHRNWRFYVTGGAEIAYDIAANEGGEKDFFNPNIALKHMNYMYMYGCGFDLYFPYFKFSPEIRIANSINNVLDPDPTVFSDSFSSIRSRLIMISFQFE